MRVVFHRAVTSRQGSLRSVCDTQKPRQS
jgi:hypothetical protein